MEAFNFDPAKKTIKFVCASCGRSWIKDVSKFFDPPKASRIKCKCPCGHIFRATLDRRRHSRKTVDFSGAYIHDRRKIRGLANFKNLSESGAGFELSTDRAMATGDQILVRFSLDDANKTFIAKEAEIKKISGLYVGVEFLSKTWPHDPLFAYLNNSS